MRIIHCLVGCLLLFPAWNWAQSSDSLHWVEVDFEYGSRPKRKCKKTESHYFGGLHGGHVSLILDQVSYGFMPLKSPPHVFAKKDKLGIFTDQYHKSAERDSLVGIKTLTITIPLNEFEYRQLQNIVQHYRDSVPYDYAFFGMRCASSTREILGQLGIMKHRKNISYVLGNFYPKRLRKKMIRLAEQRHYKMYRTTGRDCRKWERD